LAKHIPTAYSYRPTPLFCFSQQLIPGAFFRGRLLRIVHSILRRLYQLLFPFFFGVQQAFLSAFLGHGGAFWAFLPRHGVLLF